jgi:hypothetical protein
MYTTLYIICFAILSCVFCFVVVFRRAHEPFFFWGIDGGHSTLNCYYNDIIEGTVCEGENILVDTSRINVAHGGEPIESVRGRSESIKYKIYLDEINENQITG